jgi:hypothetical protein
MMVEGGLSPWGMGAAERNWIEDYYGFINEGFCMRKKWENKKIPPRSHGGSMQGSRMHLDGTIMCIPMYHDIMANF